MPGTTKTGIQFPYTFERHGRVAKVKFWPTKKVFCTYFWFGGRAVRNTFSTFEAAYRYLDREFTKLDRDPQNSVVPYPLQSSVRIYHELEQLLATRCGAGVSLREAVDFFLAHRETKQFKAQKVSECVVTFHEANSRRKVSPSYTKMSKSRLKKFVAKFGTREIHSIRASEIEEWLAPIENPKTSNHHRGVVVSLFLFARDVLQAIPDGGKVAPQRVQPAKVDKQTKVEIYSPEEMAVILQACIEHDVELLPPILLGSFVGLRPNEVHGEEARYAPLSWHAIDWERSEIHIDGQKVRGLSVRDIPIPPKALEWLRPFRGRTGNIWDRSKSYNRRLKKLIEGKANLQVVYDGFRHSYASYRIRQLKGDLNKLAEEMGNSPREIINSYKRNVRDEDTTAWFGITPLGDYSKKMAVALRTL
jgi:integrase